MVPQAIALNARLANSPTLWVALRHWEVTESNKSRWQRDLASMSKIDARNVPVGRVAPGPGRVLLLQVRGGDEHLQKFAKNVTTFPPASSDMT